MKKRLLFVDDEVFFARPYVVELEKRFDVDLRETSDGAVEALRSTSDYDAVVLDVMMPPPEGMSVTTLEGMDTGLWILRECREMFVARRIPVLVLTNRNAPYVSESVARLSLPDGLVIVRSKIETPKFVLPYTLSELVEKWGLH